MKSILRFLQAVQGQVPCTDAARRTMRHQLTSMTTYFGYPLLFVTLNPADVLHPFTWRHALDTPATALPGAHLDQDLLNALRSTQLWHVVAADPTAAVEAFHIHVATFLEELVDVPTTAAQLASDGVASSTGRGIFGPLTAAFGSIEPQQRGSLHIHFLFFCYGFQEPSSLLERFRQQLDLLQSRLWKWIQSVVVTAFEAIPPILHVPDTCLSQLRPLPYSDTNMRLMHQSYADHLLASTNHWFAADVERRLLATDFMDMPFSLDVSMEKPFLPWCLNYVTALSDPPSESMGKVMLFDLRTSIVHSGLLHSCQPRTCYKGKLGRRGYCRLGFWHWLPIGANVWERCHGIELCPKPLLGQDPPHTDSFRAERHHLFFGRVNPFILMACKCNHDVSTLLRFPADYAASPNAAELIHRKMASSMSTLLFYVTSYTTKTQPQLTSLWSMLHNATIKLQQDLRNATAPTEPLARARTTCSRLLLACQKRVHKSMQEMISYLLGYDDFYCAHAFQKLFFYSLAGRLECLHPCVASNIAAAADAARAAIIILPEDPSSSSTTPPTTQPTFWTPSSEDYPFRGEDLQDWPLYFYAAGVSRVLVSKSSFKTPGCLPFTSQHPRCKQWRQQVRTSMPWKIPHLVGPRIPTAEEDIEKRALLLLLLFKPWMHLQDLLPSTHDHPSWSSTFEAWKQTLCATISSSPDRAPALSKAFWAQRTLTILQNLDNATKVDFSQTERELDRNPDELRGHAGTTTVQNDVRDSDVASDSDRASVSDYDLPHQEPTDPCLHFSSPSISISFINFSSFHLPFCGSNP